MTTNQSNSDNPRLNLDYRKKRNAEDMKMQVISFAMMLFLTLLLFLRFIKSLADGTLCR